MSEPARVLPLPRPRHLRVVRDAARSRARAAWGLARSGAAAVLKVRAEILLAVAIVGGWALVTWGVASLLVWQVWPISGGLLLLSLSGWRYQRTLFGAGLYALTRGPRR